MEQSPGLPTDGPLAGVRVVELGVWVAGPAAAGSWPTGAPT
jgi:crotonobetainyl-CoA:carnitine CoA-transferase CaiB-like acyl-CoA transferase